MTDIPYKDKIKNHNLNEYTNDEIQDIEHERTKPEGQE